MSGKRKSCHGVNYETSLDVIVHVMKNVHGHDPEIQKDENDKNVILLREISTNLENAGIFTSDALLYLTNSQMTQMGIPEEWIVPIQTSIKQQKIASLFRKSSEGKKVSKRPRSSVPILEKRKSIVKMSPVSITPQRFPNQISLQLARRNSCKNQLGSPMFMMPAYQIYPVPIHFGGRVDANMWSS